MNGNARPIANTNALGVIWRLQSCLDEETANLLENPIANLAVYSARKGQGLMDLNRVLSSLLPLAPEGVIAEELSVLRKKIHHNMRVLRQHLAAVQEISGLLTDAIRSEDSDGTYSPAIQVHGRSA
jgi:hypothetical protein